MEWATNHPNENLVSIDSLSRSNIDRATQQNEIDDAVRVGVLQPTDSKSADGKTLYEFPIPSMWTYLKRNGSKEKTIEALRQTHAEQMATTEKPGPIGD